MEIRLTVLLFILPRSLLRMSIYSADGPNNLPWHLIVADLCKNKAPPMDDPRWTMTHDAPER